jgi:hypothetical protein
LGIDATDEARSGLGCDSTEHPSGRPAEADSTPCGAAAAAVAAAEDREIACWAEIVNRCCQ